MADQVIPYLKGVDSNNRKDVGDLYRHEIEAMSMPEFEMIEGRLMSVRRRVRFDTVVFQPVPITPAHNGWAFKKGYDEDDFKATDHSAAGKYTKTKRHTNMRLNGSFDIHDYVIIRAIEVQIVFPAGKPTTVLNGIVTDPTAILSATNYDPFLLAYQFGKAFTLEYKESDKTKVSGRLEDFPMITGGQSGFLGASQGGGTQNVAFAAVNMMNRPRIIAGQENFHVELVPTGDLFDLTSYGKEIGVEVRLHTIEYVNETA